MSDDILDRLDRWASIKVGQEIPLDLAPRDQWGPPLTQVLLDAKAEIISLRAALGAWRATLEYVSRETSDKGVAQ